jgi:ABC-type Fe3+-hydroxamate transport system substrate-binding protein
MSAVDEFVFSSPGPSCVDAVEELAAFLHPERFKAKSGK